MIDTPMQMRAPVITSAQHSCQAAERSHGTELLQEVPVLPKHPMSEAVGYVLNQWTELKVFTTDGAVPIDNTESEREMKRICLNRKNSLFVGNERGGHNAAILSSLTSTCRRHGIDPQRYLTQLLTNLPATSIRQIDDWPPDQWKLRSPLAAQG